MKVSNRAIVATVLGVCVCVLSYLLKSGNVLWALLLVLFIVEQIDD